MARFRPMLLTLASELPNGPGVAFEPKIDGFTAVVTMGDGSAQIMSRHGVDWTESFPELADLAGVANDALLENIFARLDGEPVAE
jgi:bifunctional non-homologous end joining protein LigD